MSQQLVNLTETKQVSNPRYELNYYLYRHILVRREEVSSREHESLNERIIKILPFM